MSETMIEKVARAIEFADEHDKEADGAANGYPDDVSDWAVHLARAAIEALREPTEAMLMAGFRVNVLDNHGGCPGVGEGDSNPFPRPEDIDNPTAEEGAAIEAWMKRPHCRIARATLPSDKPWAAMIDAALTPTTPS